MATKMMTCKKCNQCCGEKSHLFVCKMIEHTGKTVTGAVAGAYSGAILGSAVPVLGTAAGAAMGWLAGTMAGGGQSMNSTMMVCQICGCPESEHREKVVTKKKCYHCKAVNAFNEGFTESVNYKCYNCRGTICSMTCPHCDEDNSFPNGYKGGEAKCGGCKGCIQKAVCNHCNALCTWKNGGKGPGSKCWACRKGFA